MKVANNSFLASPGKVEQKWFVVDATNQTLGRLAGRIATILMGKHKPTYTPHIDTGDFVVVLNAGKVKVTGRRKTEQVTYQRYSFYPSGQKEHTMAQMLEKHPERVLFFAVRRMLPKNALAKHMISKMKLYTGDTHPHQAQSPEPLPN